MIIRPLSSVRSALPRGWRRPMIAAALLVLTAAIVAPALAFLRSPDPPPVAHVSVRSVATATMPDGKPAVLWATQTNAGAECLVLGVGEAAARAPGSSGGTHGGMCRPAESRPSAAQIDATVSWVRTPEGRYDVLVAGRVSRDVARLELGSEPVAINGGYFLTALPQGDSAIALPLGLSPVLIARGSNGRLIASRDLQQLVEAATP